MELAQILTGGSLIKRMAINMVIAAIDGKFPGGKVAITDVSSAISDIIDESVMLSDKNKNGQLDADEVTVFVNHIEDKLPMLLEYTSSKILAVLRSTLLSNSTVTVKPISVQ